MGRRRGNWILARPLRLFLLIGVCLPALYAACLAVDSKREGGLVPEGLVFGGFGVLIGCNAVVLLGTIVMRKHEFRSGAGSKTRRVGSLIFAAFCALAVADLSVAIVIPNFLYSGEGMKFLMVKRDFWPVAKALDAYRSDHGTYPGALGELTTPVAYLREWPTDQYAGFDLKIGGRPAFVYAPFNRQVLNNRAVFDAYAAFSVGPDRVLDVVPERDLPPDVPLTREEAEKRLVAVTYDPSNGSISAGDIVLQLGGFPKK